MEMITEAGSSARLAAKLFRGLADPTRLSILLALQAGEKRVTDLAAGLAALRPTSPGTWPASKTAAWSRTAPRAARTSTGSPGQSRPACCTPPRTCWPGSGTRSSCAELLRRLRPGAGARVTASPPITPALERGSIQWLRQARTARRLSWLSLAYMAAEGAVAVTAAILAGSVALLGFGLDSVIEALASIIVVWRFTGSRTLSRPAERRAQKVVAVTYFLLAPCIAADAIRTLITAGHPATSWPGITVSAASLIVMPLLGIAKQRIGTRLSSAAVRGEGTENLICACLAAAVLAGLLANAVLGWWWLDPSIALIIAAMAVREGRETWGGDEGEGP